MNFIEIMNCITVKNKQIDEAVKFEKSNRLFQKSFEAGSKVYQKSTDKEMGMNILLGYVSSMIEISNDPDINKKLDLTYATVKNLPVVTAYLYLNELRNNTFEKAVVTAKKSIAAYLTFLAANEEDRLILVERPDNFSEKDLLLPSSWAGLTINVGTYFSNINLLKIVQESFIANEKEILVKLDDVIDVYRMLTEKNLRAYGLDDLTATL